jgi:hypothetical protein
VSDPGRSQPQPAAFLITTQQHLRDRDTHQLRIGQQAGPAPQRLLPRWQDVITRWTYSSIRRASRFVFTH